MIVRPSSLKAMEGGSRAGPPAFRVLSALVFVSAFFVAGGCSSRDGELAEKGDTDPEAVEEFNLAVPHLNAREWQEALPHLEKAKELGFEEPEHEVMGETALADAYLNLGRYEEAVAPARRARELGVSVDSRDPMPHLMLAKALSYRWAQTEDEGLRQEARGELRLFAEKAAASGMETLEIALQGEATQHRLETGRLITDAEYFDEVYSAEGVPEEE